MKQADAVLVVMRLCYSEGERQEAIASAIDAALAAGRTDGLKRAADHCRARAEASRFARHMGGTWAVAADAIDALVKSDGGNG